MTEQDLEAISVYVKKLWPRTAFTVEEWAVLGSKVAPMSLSMAQVTAVLDELKATSRYATVKVSDIVTPLREIDRSQKRYVSTRRQIAPEPEQVQDTYPGGMGGFRAWKLWKAGRRDEVPHEWWPLMQEAERSELMRSILKTSSGKLNNATNQNEITQAARTMGNADAQRGR